jgi:hypothetical protein
LKDYKSRRIPDKALLLELGKQQKQQTKIEKSKQLKEKGSETWKQLRPSAQEKQATNKNYKGNSSSP